MCQCDTGQRDHLRSRSAGRQIPGHHHHTLAVWWCARSSPGKVGIDRDHRGDQVENADLILAPESGDLICPHCHVDCPTMAPLE
ncbi:hypothetical protein RHA1_ro08943 (plasmid) [Rhodococcus jostii RHA1]|uniref:Uncharacterized protein n=1 Tax=Rhodococcus jostii (strain RHA1) TaxID=101510 RepID=Q0RXJ9_RHOJR|nr:hypothetical protein RHA1_ro08943 [Rhodococcus jostii RHA1]